MFDRESTIFGDRTVCLRKFLFIELRTNSTFNRDIALFVDRTVRLIEKFVIS